MNILYAKMSNDRKDIFKINTKIVSENGKKYVLKTAATEVARAHVQSLCHKSKIISDLYGDAIHVIVPESHGDDMVKYQYIEGELLADKIKRLAKDGQHERAVTEVVRFADLLSSRTTEVFKDCEAFRTVFGDVYFNQEMLAVNPANVDISFENVVVDVNEKLHLIDCEWTYEFPVPVQYILYRAILVFGNISEELRKQLYSAVGIDEKSLEIFSGMEASFSRMVHGQEYTLEDYGRVLGKNKVIVDHYSLMRKPKRYVGKCYFDCNGLSEENIAPFEFLDKNIATGRIAIPKGCTAIRFDPVENYGCIVSNLIIGGSNGVLTVQSGNYNCEMNGSYYFATFDPQFYILLPNNAVWVEISCAILIIDSVLGQKVISDLEMQIECRMSETAQFQEKCGAIELEQKQRIEKLELKHTLEIKKMNLALESLSEKYESIRGKNFDIEQELKQTRSCCHEITTERDDLRGQVTYWRESFQTISNSEFWKITLPARKLMDGIKWVFIRNHFVVLIRKGLSSIRSVGIKATWKRVKKKLGGSSENLMVEPKKKKFKCVGKLPQNKLDKLYNTVIDIIVPVYNGFEYFPMLFKTIEQTKVPYHLILIDDKSRDTRVLPYLRAYAKGKENIQLLENTVNLGFVQTVNRGLGLSKGNVAIVNTDVILPPMWLERLMYPIILGEKIASSTPFTNSGTVCSFPNFCEDNCLFFGLNVNEIDRVFQEYTPEYPILPSGVGFCMGMSRKAIDQIGILDAETFDRGYGEENDWCRRAAEAGFVNVLVENLFVYHKHGGSFETEEKKQLIEEHLALVNQKHPGYERLVSEFCNSDPCEWLRFDVKKKLLKGFYPAYAILAFSHNWGGGADMYLIKERARLLNEGKELIQVKYDQGSHTFLVEFFYDRYYERFNVEGDITNVFSILPKAIDEIWINVLVSFPDLYGTLEKISELAEKNGAFVLYLLHDFFAICPTINLLTENGVYCQVPEQAICQKCLERNPRFHDLHCVERKLGISIWRQNWSRFFENCDEIRTFSESSRRILRKAYPDIPEDKVTMRPHAIDYLPEISTKKKHTTTLNIAVIGGINEIKGVNIVAEMAKLIRLYGENACITVIGKPWPDIPEGLCHCTGSYERTSLPSLVLENDIDIILIPSIWPETFSYTCQEAMRMGLPVACFDIGAPAERVKVYDKGIIVPQINADIALLTLLKYGETHNIMRVSAYKKVLFVTEQFNDSSCDRIRCFREELLFRGITSESLFMEQAVQKRLDEFCAIVFYHCTSIVGASCLRNRAKRLGIGVFSDVDDLIFDAEFIKGSELSSEEKQQSINKHLGYSEVIRLCDGIIASTQVVADRLHGIFPDKPTCVRSNSVNLEFETFSVYEGDKNNSKSGDIVYLGYFHDIGSNSLSLEIIESPLAEIMKRYPNVVLQLHGYVKIPAAIKEFRSRIETYELAPDWKTHLESLSKVHVCLMPYADVAFEERNAVDKWVEASLVRCPVVASCDAELKEIIRPNITGLLCENSQEWKSALSNLIEEFELRNQIGKNAQEEVLQTRLSRNSSSEAVNFIIGN